MAVATVPNNCDCKIAWRAKEDLHGTLACNLEEGDSWAEQGPPTGLLRADECKRSDCSPSVAEVLILPRIRVRTGESPLQPRSPPAAPSSHPHPFVIDRHNRTITPAFHRRSPRPISSLGRICICRGRHRVLDVDPSSPSRRPDAAHAHSDHSNPIPNLIPNPSLQRPSSMSIRTSSSCPLGRRGQGGRRESECGVSSSTRSCPHPISRRSHRLRSR